MYDVIERQIAACWIARLLVAAMARAARLGDRLVPHVTDDAHAGERPFDLPSERRWASLYDADCGFCKWLLSALLWWDRSARLHPIALQRSEADHLLQERRHGGWIRFPDAEP